MLRSAQPVDPAAGIDPAVQTAISLGFRAVTPY
jgi:hypothetical protein